MPFAFDQTVGGANATNTASVEFADAYFETRPFSDAWTNLSPTSRKQVFLIAASNRLNDEEATLAGRRLNTVQRLCQPRINGYDDCDASYALPDVRNGSQIDRLWLEAECEMALFLAEQKTSPTSVDKLAPFSAVKMPSGLELTMREKNPRNNDALPVAVRRKLRRFRAATADEVVRA